MLLTKACMTCERLILRDYNVNKINMFSISYLFSEGKSHAPANILSRDYQQPNPMCYHKSIARNLLAQD